MSIPVDLAGASDPAALEFLRDGGEMGALMRQHDWATSSLGMPATWPQSLRTAVRLLLNTGHPMYIFWGEDGACLYNDAYRASIGPERHPGSLGRPALEVWEEIWPIIGPQVEQVMSGGGATWNVNHLVPITRYGRREDVYWTYSYSPIDDAQSSRGIGGVLVVCTETTQQVLAARRLTSERDRMAQLFEQAPTFMALLRGPTHRFEIVNPAYLQLVGDRPVVGRTVAEALPDAAEQGYVSLLDEVFASGVAYLATGAKYAMTLTAGEPIVERFVDFVYQPIREPDGAISGIFVVGVDATERSMADLRSRQMAAELQDANRLKDEFLATLAHELRNPLAPIRNALELMKLAPTEPGVVRSALDIMGRQLTQVVRLTDDLLDLSRVSRGVVALQRESIALAAVLKDAIDTSRPAVDQLGHALSVDVPAGIILAADPTRMVQVFANIINNAVKFTPPGGEIAIGIHDLSSDAVVVSVRDSGMGIPPEQLTRVFDMFAQVDRSHAHIGGGLGIGLTLVRRLVEMHGGTVEARSAGSGRGSEFLVRLPLSLPIATAAGAPRAAAAVAARPVVGRRIVIADDNIDAADSLAMMLSIVGHETRTAHDGRMALDVAREFRPQAMVLDIAMPGLDGHELARAIRREPWGATTLLIAVSGWGQAEHKRQSLEAGFDHHLVKPVDLEVMEQVLREIAD